LFGQKYKLYGVRKTKSGRNQGEKRKGVYGVRKTKLTTKKGEKRKRCKRNDLDGLGSFVPFPINYRDGDDKLVQKRLATKAPRHQVLLNSKAAFHC
jgi:hypothetical protein